MESERRRHARYNRDNLELDVARPGIKGMLSLNSRSRCHDFCLAGLRFASETEFMVGEQLILDLRVYDVAVTEVKAQVICCETEGQNHYCTGVRFCFEDKSMQKPEISHALLHIEDKLRSAQEYPTSQTAV